MKRYYRPKTLGPTIKNGESVFYVILEGEMPEGFVTDFIPAQAMRQPISCGGLTLVVNR